MTSLCVLCRGSKHLCGRSYCPALLKSFERFVKIQASVSQTVFGSSPPAVFVGWSRYPRVFVSIGVPNVVGDTRIMDLPESWINLSLDQVLLYRLSLFFGGKRVSSVDPRDPFVGRLREVVMSWKPVDVEVRFEKRPRIKHVVGDVEPPMGPRGLVNEFRIASEPKIPRTIERIVEDDLSARDAAIELYLRGVPVSYIQKLFSVACLGKKNRRRLVPTRWSITAVDKILSDYLVSRIKHLPKLDTYLVFIHRVEKNLFVAILLPGAWSFEWMEAWFPGSIWNLYGSEVVIEGDHEFYGGRDEYPSIGGCYYASRLAVAEYLLNVLRRQATAILLREIYQGFDIAIGVWYVRENVREMFRKSPIKCSTLKEVLEVLDRETVLGARRWVKASKLLSYAINVRKLDAFSRLAQQ